MIARKIAPALAAGCTVVCKPAEDTPLTVAGAGARWREEAGVPAGVVNIVTASRERTPEVVDVWLDDARVRKITFTGSTPVGKHLARASRRHAQEAVAGAGRQRALHRVRRCRPRCRGRRPDGGQVPQRRPDLRLPEPRVSCSEACTTRFVDKLAARVGALQVGPATDARLADRPDDQCPRGREDRAPRAGRRRQRRQAASSAAQRLPTRGRPLLRAHGARRCRRQRWRCACEETFGPVVPVTRFDTEDEVGRRWPTTRPSAWPPTSTRSDSARIWRVAERAGGRHRRRQRGRAGGRGRAVRRRQGIGLWPRRLAPRPGRLPAHQVPLPGAACD